MKDLLMKHGTSKHLMERPAPESLMVRLTHDCNMACSFCHIAEEMKDKTTVDVASVLEEYLERMDGLPSYLAINGGEPLLDRVVMGEILSVALSASEDMKIDIMTNGTKLDYAYAEIFNAYDNISTCISITGVNKGEKSLNKLIQIARNAEVVQVIQSLKKKRIRYVVPNFKDDFELDVLSLINIFDCKVEISLDFESMPKLEIDDVYYLQKTISRFYALGILDKVTFTSFFDSGCDCRTSHVIKPNGDIQFKSNALGDDKTSIGCSYVSKIMPLGLYPIFRKVVAQSKELIGALNPPENI